MEYTSVSRAEILLQMSPQKTTKGSDNTVRNEVPCESLLTIIPKSGNWLIANRFHQCGIDVSNMVHCEIVTYNYFKILYFTAFNLSFHFPHQMSKEFTLAEA